MKKFFNTIFLILFCVIFMAGCGGDSSNEGGQSVSLEFKPLESPGYYGSLKMQPNGEFYVRNKLTEAQVQSAGVVYNVEFNDENKLVKITAMQGGTPINIAWQDTLGNEFSFSALTVEYAGNQKRYNFRSSRMAATTGYYVAYTIGYKISDNEKKPPIAFLYDKEGNQSDRGDGFSQMFFTYDDKNGNLTKIVFADKEGNRLTTVNGEYEIQIKYDKKFNTPVEISNIGKDGSLKVASNGIAKTTYKLDDKGRTVEIRHFGADEMLKDKNINALFELNKPLTSTSAGAITKYTYEGNTDRVAKISFLGKDEQAEGIKSWGGISSLEFNYTPEGWISSMASFATDDSPIAIDKNFLGDNVVKVEFEHDNAGNLSKMIFYGKENNLVTASALGAAECRYKYDEKRRETGVEYYGTGGEKIEVNAFGLKYHGITKEYNDDDELTLLIYYNKDAKEIKRENLKEGTSAPTQTNNNPAPQNTTEVPPLGYGWIKDNTSDIYMENPSPTEGETISWSGGYVQDGNYKYADGFGTTTWRKYGNVIQVDEGTFVHGRRHGSYKHQFFPSGKIEYSNWDNGREI